MTTRVYAWHVHHDELVEPLLAPIEERQEFIRRYKPDDEIALRLRLLQPVRSPLPVAYTQAWETFLEAQTAYSEAISRATAADDEAKAFLAALDALDQVRETYEVRLEAIHVLECPDCPWDGRTIFPQRGT